MRNILIAMFLVGCSSARHIASQNGQDLVAITCKRDQSNCWERAAQECPKGFAIVDETGQVNNFIVNTGNAYTGPQYYMGSAYNGSLLVECKP